jgi:tetratricopeptide (TPR) repeat protein
VGADAERLIAAGDPTAAIAATKRANELGERAYPDNQVDRADYHFNLARALDAAGRTEDAEREIDSALALAARARGEAHPMLASELVLAAELEQRLGKIDAAISNARRAVAIDEGWYGATDPRLAHSLNTLGQLLALTGDVAKARAPLERALALDPDGKRTSVRLSLTMLEAQSGNYARAIEVGGAELAQPDRDTGADMSMMLALGISHRELHHLADSLKYLTGAHELAVAAQGASSGQSINVAIELSYTLVAMGRGPAAVQLLSPALATTDLPPPVAAELHSAYGQALWATGDRDGARRELAAARDAYLALGDPFASERAKADAWLRAHP